MNDPKFVGNRDQQHIYTRFNCASVIIVVIVMMIEDHRNGNLHG